LGKIVNRKSGWKKYFTLFYWKLQWSFLCSRGTPVNIVEVIEIDATNLPESVTKYLIPKN
jgi:hypothetical protein